MIDDRDPWVHASNALTKRKKISKMAPYSTFEKDILKHINNYRINQKLEPLVFNPKIQETAALHSNNMAKGKVPLGHDGFSKRAKLLVDALEGTAAAENVALGQRTPKEVVDSWLESPPHRQNIEGDFNLTGIAVEQNDKKEHLFTQIFIKAPNPKGVSDNPPFLSKAATEQNLNYTLLKLINDYRQTQYLPTLTIDGVIQQAATQHAKKMAEGEVDFGHAGFQQRAGDLLQAVKGKAVAENVALGQAEVKTIFDSWIKSKDHQKNIVGDFNRTGIGIAKDKEGKYFYCQIFIKK